MGCAQPTYNQFDAASESQAQINIANKFFTLKFEDESSGSSALTIMKKKYNYNEFMFEVSSQLSVTGFDGDFHLKTSSKNPDTPKYIISANNFAELIKSFSEFEIVKHKSKKLLTKSYKPNRSPRTPRSTSNNDFAIDENKEEDIDKLIKIKPKMKTNLSRNSAMLFKRNSIVTLDHDMLDEAMGTDDKLKVMTKQNEVLKNLLIMAENQQYGGSDNPLVLSPSDIETIRAIFDTVDRNSNGKIDVEEVKELYLKMGDIINDNDAKKIVSKLDPKKTGEIEFNSFLMYWHNSHKYGKKGKEYKNNFKFLSNRLKGNFDLNKLHVKEVGKKFTTDYRVYFEYEQNDGHLKKISPWHDIPLRPMVDNSNIFNFICEIPKWTRAKFEIATGEEFNPIKQDTKKGKLRFYQHGDIFFNYGALSQTYEDPNHIPKDTGCPGDNDPLDVIEIGTKQLKTGSVTPVKALGVLALLDSGETDWKILAININDPLANILNDVNHIDKELPGAIDAIREYLRIYKVVTGKAENRYALRGEAMNAKYALKVIEECYQQWRHLNIKRKGDKDVKKDEKNDGDKNDDEQKQDE